MADQIFADGPITAPAKYVVPGSSEIIPIAVQAEIDGTNASGDFVPTLIFRSQAGHVIARVPTSTTVPAGGSAEISWFPHVGATATAAPSSTLSYAWGWRDNGSGDPNIFLNAGASITVPFIHATTTNPAVFTWATVANPNDRLILGAPGLYLIALSGNMTIDPTYAFYLIAAAGDQLQHSSINTNGAGGSSGPARGLSSNQDYSIFNVASNTTLRAFVQNNTATTQTVIASYLSAIYLGVPA